MSSANFYDNEAVWKIEGTLLVDDTIHGTMVDFWDGRGRSYGRNETLAVKFACFMCGDRV